MVAFLLISCLLLLLPLRVRTSARGECSWFSASFPPYSSCAKSLKSNSRLRRLGSTLFAEHAERSKLSTKNLEAYFAEGFLLLKGFLAPGLVAALRELLLHRFVPPVMANTWIESDALFDFLVFGPFGKVASQLLNSTTTHLLCSNLHFRDPETKLVPEYHYDNGDCLTGFPPARHTRRTLVKFWIPLYDGMPSMWFVNQSSFEAHLLQASDEHALREFHAGRLPPPSDQCHPEHRHFQKFGSCPSWVPPMPQQKADHLSMKPTMRLGDVLVHSTTLMHRSSERHNDDVTGWLSVMYGAKTSRWIGDCMKRLNCDPGMDFRSLQVPPRVQEVVAVSPCFPVAFPKPRRPVGPYRIPLRSLDPSDAAKDKSYLLRWRHRQRWHSTVRNLSGFRAFPQAPRHDVPASNIANLV